VRSFSFDPAPAAQPQAVLVVNPAPGAQGSSRLDDSFSGILSINF
jgi:hypothetical protein